MKPTPPHNDSYRLLWVDCEMTGLDEQRHRMIEIAAILTDANFQEIATYESVIYQPKEVLAQMDPWCVEHHGASGLTAQIATGRTTTECEAAILQLIAQHCDASIRPVLAGNSIHNDKRFLDREMPNLMARLHYRLVDVSSFKEIFRERFAFTVAKGNSHRALEDIRDSIRELDIYLRCVSHDAVDEQRGD